MHDIFVGTWRAVRDKQDDITEDEALEALLQLDPLWDELIPAEQARIAQLLVERVEVRMDGVEVRLRPNGLAGLVREWAPRPRVDNAMVNLLARGVPVPGAPARGMRQRRWRTLR